MNEKQYLHEIKRMIETLSEKKFYDELKVVKEMVSFRSSHSTPELTSLKDVYYFICGILFSKGLSDYWNGRDKGCLGDIKRNTESTVSTGVKK